MPDWLGYAPRSSHRRLTSVHTRRKRSRYCDVAGGDCGGREVVSMPAPPALPKFRSVSKVSNSTKNINRDKKRKEEEKKKHHTKKNNIYTQSRTAKRRRSNSSSSSIERSRAMMAKRADNGGRGIDGFSSSSPPVSKEYYQVDNQDPGKISQVPPSHAPLVVRGHHHNDWS